MKVQVIGQPSSPVVNPVPQIPPVAAPSSAAVGVGETAPQTNLPQNSNTGSGSSSGGSSSGSPVNPSGMMGGQPTGGASAQPQGGGSADGSSGGPGGYRPAVGETAFIGDKLSCVRDGSETCSGVELQLGPAPTNGDKQAFINWIKPAALYVQAMTGFPAAVIIGQAALETAWGTSVNFTQRNSLFGHSCWNGATQTGEVDLGPKKFSWTGHCNANRPEGGMYLSFPNKSESFLAYLTLILQSRGRYLGAQRLSASAARGGSPGVASWSMVIRDIAASGYAADNAYAQKVGEIISNYRLDQLSDNECQRCVHERRKNGGGFSSSEATT